MGEALGFKMNFGRNYFYTSGKIPLDIVAAGQLDRFGFIDPTTGGRIRTGIVGAYYRKEWKDGSVFKADGFLTRWLFDLFSNFTLFLTDLNKQDERLVQARSHSSSTAQANGSSVWFTCAVAPPSVMRSIGRVSGARTLLA